MPFESKSDDVFSLSKIKDVVVDARYQHEVDRDGQTLIPPTLHQFANTFAQDLQPVLDRRISVRTGRKPPHNGIFITLDRHGKYLDAAGRPTSEGYTLEVTSNGIVIKGASPLGAWWGTRTVLQQAILNDGNIQLGSGRDAPGWGTRGIMLDVGRKFYPKEFIIEMCSYISFFKQNVFHLHLSDNLYNNPNYTREESLNLYARFRLWSEDPRVAGLNKHRNESYSRREFEEIQHKCAARGVTILPEIEAPGHALVIVQWKPQLGLSTDLSLLNISHPETIPTLRNIWSTFLPWFHSKTVSIGADEYTDSVTEYTRFVNAMNDHIKRVSGKSIRIWGTFPPNKTEGVENVDKDVSIQHWEFFEDNPYYDFILNGYSVLNSDDTFYIVNKWSGFYPQRINLTRAFYGNPAGGPWYPQIFDIHNSSNNPTRDEPLVLGAIAAQWNDFGYNASVVSEAYYNWRDGIPALADKQWGGDISESEYSSIEAKLHPHIPDQNLDRTIKSKSPVIVDYDFSKTHFGTVRDVSGNGYHAHTHCREEHSALQIQPSCSLTTPLDSKGRDYTLSLTLRIHKLDQKAPATLVTGRDSALLLTPNITLAADGNHYTLNTTIPLHTWVDLDIISRGNRTCASIKTDSDEQPQEHEFIARLGINGQYFVWAPIAIEAPLHKVGGAHSGWSGELRRFKLTEGTGN